MRDLEGGGKPKKVSKQKNSKNQKPPQTPTKKSPGKATAQSPKNQVSSLVEANKETQKTSPVPVPQQKPLTVENIQLQKERAQAVLTKQVLDGLSGKDGKDVVEAFLEPYPTRALAEILLRVAAVDPGALVLRKISFESFVRRSAEAFPDTDYGLPMGLQPCADSLSRVVYSMPRPHLVRVCVLMARADPMAMSMRGIRAVAAVQLLAGHVASGSGDADEIGKLYERPEEEPLEMPILPVSPPVAGGNTDGDVSSRSGIPVAEGSLASAVVEDPSFQDEHTEAASMLRANVSLGGDDTSAEGGFIRQTYVVPGKAVRRQLVTDDAISTSRQQLMDVKNQVRNIHETVSSAAEKYGKKSSSSKPEPIHPGSDLDSTPVRVPQPPAKPMPDKADRKKWRIEGKRRVADRPLPEEPTVVTPADPILERQGSILLKTFQYGLQPTLDLANRMVVRSPNGDNIPIITEEGDEVFPFDEGPLSGMGIEVVEEGDDENDLGEEEEDVAESQDCNHSGRPKMNIQRLIIPESGDSDYRETSSSMTRTPRERGVAASPRVKQNPPPRALGTFKQEGSMYAMRVNAPSAASMDFRGSGEVGRKAPNLIRRNSSGGAASPIIRSPVSEAVGGSEDSYFTPHTSLPPNVPSEPVDAAPMEPRDRTEEEKRIEHKRSMLASDPALDMPNSLQLGSTIHKAMEAGLSSNDSIARFATPRKRTNQRNPLLLPSVPVPEVIANSTPSPPRPQGLPRSAKRNGESPHSPNKNTESTVIVVEEGTRIVKRSPSPRKVRLKRPLQGGSPVAVLVPLDEKDNEVCSDVIHPQMPPPKTPGDHAFRRPIPEERMDNIDGASTDVESAVYESFTRGVARKFVSDVDGSPRILLSRGKGTIGLELDDVEPPSPAKIGVADRDPTSPKSPQQVALEEIDGILTRGRERLESMQKMLQEVKAQASGTSLGESPSKSSLRNDPRKFTVEESSPHPAPKQPKPALHAEEDEEEEDEEEENAKEPEAPVSAVDEQVKRLAQHLEEERLARLHQEAEATRAMVQLSLEKKALEGESQNKAHEYEERIHEISEELSQEKLKRAEIETRMAELGGATDEEALPCKPNAINSANPKSQISVDVDDGSDGSEEKSQYVRKGFKVLRCTPTVQNPFPPGEQHGLVSPRTEKRIMDTFGDDELSAEAVSPEGSGPNVHDSTVVEGPPWPVAYSPSGDSIGLNAHSENELYQVEVDGTVGGEEEVTSADLALACAGDGGEHNPENGENRSEPDQEELKTMQSRESEDVANANNEGTVQNMSGSAHAHEDTVPSEEARKETDKETDTRTRMEILDDEIRELATRIYMIYTRDKLKPFTSSTFLKFFKVSRIVNNSVTYSFCDMMYSTAISELNKEADPGEWGAPMMPEEVFAATLMEIAQIRYPKSTEEGAKEKLLERNIRPVASRLQKHLEKESKELDEEADVIFSGDVVSVLRSHDIQRAVQVLFRYYMALDNDGDSWEEIQYSKTGVSLDELNRFVKDFSLYGDQLTRSSLEVIFHAANTGVFGDDDVALCSYAEFEECLSRIALRAKIPSKLRQGSASEKLRAFFHHLANDDTVQTIEEKLHLHRGKLVALLNETADSGQKQQRSPKKKKKLTPHPPSKSRQSTQSPRSSTKTTPRGSRRGSVNSSRASTPTTAAIQADREKLSNAFQNLSLEMPRKGRGDKSPRGSSFSTTEYGLVEDELNAPLDDLMKQLK